MGNGFSCIAKGDVKAGDSFEVSGEVQIEVKGKEQHEEQKEDKK